MLERDSHGRFAKGNTGGPGRPAAVIEADYLTAIADAVPLEVWAKIAERAVVDALNGDGRARDWLAKYLVGDGGSLLRNAALAHLGISTKAIIMATACDYEDTTALLYSPRGEYRAIATTWRDDNEDGDDARDDNEDGDDARDDNEDGDDARDDNEGG